MFYKFLWFFFLNWVVFLIQHVKVTQFTYTYEHFPAHEMVMLGPPMQTFVAVVFLGLKLKGLICQAYTMAEL